MEDSGIHLWIGKIIFWGERLISRVTQIMFLCGGIAWLRVNGVRWYYFPFMLILALLILWFEYKFVIKSHGKEWKKYYGN